MEASPAKGKFQLTGMSGKATIRVIGEDRTIRLQDGRFEDDFGPYAVHLYQIDGAGNGGVLFRTGDGTIAGYGRCR